MNNNGLYIVEDLQTSYLPRYGGSRYNLLKKNTSMNYLKSIADSINYEQNNKPFFKKKKFDGCVKYVHFYQNLAIIKKGESLKYYYKEAQEKKHWIEVIKKFISYIYR